jgi:microcompartment protein CcmL/EutN
LGIRKKIASESIGIFETKSAASTIKSADAAVKGANIEIIEMRLADDIGGKGFVIYSGKIEEIQEALSISTEKLSSPELLLNKSIIPNLHSEMAKQLDSSSIFMNNNLTKLEGGEI